jgi:hypothetical protein
MVVEFMAIGRSLNSLNRNPELEISNSRFAKILSRLLLGGFHSVQDILKVLPLFHRNSNSVLGPAGVPLRGHIFPDVDSDRAAKFGLLNDNLRGVVLPDSSQLAHSISLAFYGFSGISGFLHGCTDLVAVRLLNSQIIIFARIT